MNDKDEWDWARILYMLTAYLDGPPEGMTYEDLLDQYDNLPQETKDYFEKSAKEVEREDEE